MKLDIKQFALAIGLAFVVLTILNLLVHEVWGDIPVIKSGKALILILVSITIVMLFVFASDKRFEKSEIFMFILILAVMIGIFYITKKYIPELFSLFPDSLKEIGNGIIS